MSWLRLHDSVPDNPKVQALKPDLFKAWVNILCIAKRTGGILPTMQDLGFALRTTPSRAAGYVKALKDANLIDDDGNGGLVPHDWNDHQYVSDSSTQRVQRHRAKKRNGDETLQETPVTSVTETPPLTETEQNTEQSREEKKEGAQRAPRAMRLALDALPDEWKAYCVENHPRLNPEAMWHEFHDYWKARAGEKARKHDWLATWRTWLRRAEDFKSNGQLGQRKPSDLDNRRATVEAIDEVVALAEARRRGLGTG